MIDWNGYGWPEELSQVGVNTAYYDPRQLFWSPCSSFKQRKKSFVAFWQINWCVQLLLHCYWRHFSYLSLTKLHNVWFFCQMDLFLWEISLASSFTVHAWNLKMPASRDHLRLLLYLCYNSPLRCAKSNLKFRQNVEFLHRIYDWDPYIDLRPRTDEKEYFNLFLQHGNFAQICIVDQTSNRISCQFLIFDNTPLLHSGRD